MKTLGSALIVATMMGAPAAYAQQMDSTSSNQVTVMAIAQPQTLGPSEQKVTYDGHTWTTPSAQGSYFGGANPCLIGTGGGAAGGPVAFNINIGRSDEGCQRRSDAAAWHAMGFDNVAIARMCQDIKSADAFFAATGQACPGAASGRYKLADGSAAPRASLVANSRAIPSNPYAGPVDLNNPAVQAAIRAEAQRLVRGTSTTTGASATPRSPQSVSPGAASVGQ